jgi:hypothetical protein
VRGRFGYAFDNVLLYGMAGWAWSSNQYVRTQLIGTLNNATSGADEAVNRYLSGWTAGAGVSIALAQNWNVFAEYIQWLDGRRRHRVRDPNAILGRIEYRYTNLQAPGFVNIPADIAGGGTRTPIPAPGNSSIKNMSPSASSANCYIRATIQRIYAGRYGPVQ